ncbi:outer membrane biosynthesis protein TonB [Streptosporangium becharense]|uniref:Outer membrane biosynthesis protein TonB n=1 Tax=Streptosporangium becharense TaxID=1816182 RepID=A0A7W9IEA4_9ACTN|nr:hypothetical protein [Streptosporangium becharense]MBB2912159.1 outer membrane biosynthesis protein TonB [Streptosporangium becharense]MBB5818706.1 outer membrane biosynthesis protein TonB [Streptosporangium becharense]
MTDSPDEYGELLRRALNAEANSVVPSPDGLEIIRARIERRGLRNLMWWRVGASVAGAALVAATVVMVVPQLREQVIPEVSTGEVNFTESTPPDLSATSRPPAPPAPTPLPAVSRPTNAPSATPSPTPTRSTSPSPRPTTPRATPTPSPTPTPCPTAVQGEPAEPAGPTARCDEGEPAPTPTEPTTPSPSGCPSDDCPSPDDSSPPLPVEDGAPTPVGG